MYREMNATKDLKAVCEQAAASLGYSQLKPQQLEAMMAFISGKDVFVVLPTGFGKSLIYASLPLAFDVLRASNDSVVVVITPLTAIMKDQVILLGVKHTVVHKLTFAHTLSHTLLHTFLGC